MDFLSLIIGFVCGAIITLMLTWLIRRGSEAYVRNQVELLQQQISKLNERLSFHQQENARLTTMLENQQELMKEKELFYQSSKAQLTETFQSLSHQTLEKSTEHLLAIAKATFNEFQKGSQQTHQEREKALSSVIEPIKETLKKVQSQVEEVEKQRISAYASIKQEIQMLAKGNAELRSETNNLVNALQAPTVRGRWGEIQLRRVVELAGMVSHCDFFEQESVEDALRPDMIIRLPGDKNVVVDAKAPLKAYLEAIESNSEEQKAKLMSAHAAHIRDHLKKLSAKAYWQKLNPTPEFVVMFLPGENFFSAALQQDRGLIEAGVEQRVILATPTTLIALLRAVAYGWRQEQLTENATFISELGKTLYERLLVLTNHFDDLRKGLQRSVEAYNKAVGSYENRVITTARKFHDMGVTGQKELPSLDLIDEGLRSASKDSPT